MFLHRKYNNKRWPGCSKHDAGFKIAIPLFPYEPLEKRTYPKDEVENEKQIFHAFHPAVHFAHDVTWFVDIPDLWARLLFC